MNSKNVVGVIDVSSINQLSKEQFEELSAGRSVTGTLTASTGNFQGELTYSYSWNPDGTRFEFSTSQYRIKRFNGQDGGNKANINFMLVGAGGIYTSESPDSMWQDSEWHSYSRGGLFVANRTVICVASFIFDKSGSDPSASTGAHFEFQKWSDPETR